MFELTQDICSASGFEAYEVSNHAKPGAESRHNLTYWRYGDYAGVGPGAHGRLTRNEQKHASVGWQTPGKWLAQAEAGNGDETFETIPAREQVVEQVLMGLRLREGISVSRLHALSRKTVDQKGLAELRDLGMVEIAGDRLIATQAGRPVLNAVIEKLIAG